MRSSSLALFPWLATLALLTGCATEAKYDRKVQTWVGRSSDSVTQAWGQPDANEKRPNGDHVLVYARLKRPPVSYGESQRALASGATPASDVYIKCATYFEIGPDGQVVKTLFRGPECKARK